MDSRPVIRVKFLYPGPSPLYTRRWLLQFPGGLPRWGRCEFLFDPGETRYDWLVVYSDLPRSGGKSGREPLCCDRRHTLLVTSEPSSVNVYGRDYTRQFAHVLSGQEDWALRHPGKIHSQPALHWFYGVDYSSEGEDFLGYDHVRNHPPAEGKREEVSTVCSTKRMRYSLHMRRLAFVRRLQQDLAALHWFNREVRPFGLKASTLDPYAYHLAIENHIASHWWTEKISDTFLGLCLPFYCGAPNLADYFPADSFVPIDIFRYRESRETIERTLRDRAYGKRLPAIREAKRRVMEEYNTFAVLSRLIEERHQPGGQPPANGEILSKRLVRKRPAAALRNGWEKVAVRARCYLRYARGR